MNVLHQGSELAWPKEGKEVGSANEEAKDKEKGATAPQKITDEKTELAVIEPAAVEQPAAALAGESFLTDEMRRKHQRTGLPESVLMGFDTWYADRTHLYPDANLAFTKHLNTAQTQARSRALAH